MSGSSVPLIIPQQAPPDPMNRAMVQLDPQVDRFFNFKLVSFKAENTVFRVLTYGLDHPGTIFEAMFSLPAAENGEGSSNENPIVLEGVLASHFRSFLCVLYSDFGNQAKSVVKFDDWVGVLELSTKWECKKVRARAITSLSRSLLQKSVLEKLHLGRKYRVVDWILDALVTLSAKTSFRMEEVTDCPFGLDWKTIAHILYVRELRTNMPKGIPVSNDHAHVGPFLEPCYGCDGYQLFGISKEAKVRELVKKTFQEDLGNARNEDT